jgi:hypothetical protein
MSRQPIDKNYVSDVDQFLLEFDKNHPILTPSQQKERNKFLRVQRLQEGSADTAQSANKIWEGF